MTKRVQRRPDRPLAAVERIIEDQLPGGSSGVDARSMAQAIVRHVRTTEPAGKTAALAELPGGSARRRPPRQAVPPDGEDGASARGDRRG
ncbi:hypothetical protein [Streptomyces sp. NPDC050988]|uniref:hypothetical protein n=1 Tax=Streptomyces sp. NPDC050988 TaxID=3365637 RepID=UPI0037896DFE